MVRRFFLKALEANNNTLGGNYCTSKKGPLVHLVPFTPLYTTTCFYDKFKLSKPIVWKRWHQQPLVTRLLGRGRKQERTNCAIRVARPGVFVEGMERITKGTWLEEQNLKSWQARMMYCTYIKYNNMLHRTCFIHIIECKVFAFKTLSTLLPDHTQTPMAALRIHRF